MYSAWCASILLPDMRTGGRGMEGGRGGPGERGTWRCEDSRIFLKRKENSLKSWQAADKAPVFYGKK